MLYIATDQDNMCCGVQLRRNFKHKIYESLYKCMVIFGYLILA